MWPKLFKFIMVSRYYVANDFCVVLSCLLLKSNHLITLKDHDMIISQKPFDLIFQHEWLSLVQKTLHFVQFRLEFERDV